MYQEKRHPLFIAFKILDDLIKQREFYLFSGFVCLFFFLVSFSQVSKAEIIDNTDPGFVTAGTWTSSTSIPGFYGSNYLYSPPGGGSKATWYFDIPTTGEYEISASWVSSSGNASNAPYKIRNIENYDASKEVILATVKVDQRKNGGKFNLLGTFTLKAGLLKVELRNNVTSGNVIADAVQIVLIQSGGTLEIISPSDLDLKTSQNVLVEASAVGFPPDWGVEFIIDGDFANIIPGGACNPPSQDMVCANLTGLSLAEHTIDARMVNSSGNPEPFTDHVAFGVGDYYVGLGDSITRGSKDNITSDNVSDDGRNSGGGYEPILNNLLTAGLGYPHTVINAGVSGNKSIDGVNRISSVLASNPDSQYFLVQFGTNDALTLPPVPSGQGTSPEVNVIIDNTDPGFVTAGTWTSSTSIPGFYGSNYLYSPPGGGSKATWYFDIPTTGEYEISASWVSSSGNASNAPYKIRNIENYDASKEVILATVKVDQRKNGGKFNLLGTFTLKAGLLKVELRNNVTSGNVIADAVQIYSSGSGYAGSYKDNMQRIIDAIIEAGKEPLLAKVPILYAPCGSNEPFLDPDNAPQNILIREYNAVIDELVASNNIQVTPPDFYNHFRDHPEEIADFCHPNGVGYQSMANLWLNALIQ